MRQPLRSAVSKRGGSDPGWVLIEWKTHRTLRQTLGLECLSRLVGTLFIYIHKQSNLPWGGVGVMMKRPPCVLNKYSKCYLLAFERGGRGADDH